MKQPIDWQNKYPLACVGGFYKEFNAGWDKIVCDMFDKIEPVLQDIYTLEPEKSQELENQFRVAQIKEKFASLRVYIDYPNFWVDQYKDKCETIQSAIRTAGDLSTETCELCGEAGKVVGTGWLSCRCAKCNNYKLIESEKTND